MKVNKPILLIMLAMLMGCETESPQGFGNFLGESDSSYSQVKQGTPLSFPEDHKAHTDFRHEWWYLTANLKDENGEDIGIQWTQFRVATSPNMNQASSENTWATQQIYMAHSAVTTSEVHYADEKWSRGNPELSGVDVEPFRVFVDDWQWVSKSKEMFPADLTASSPQFSYQLHLSSSAPFHKQGKDGYSEKSVDGSVASHYYSQPFITVTGTVTINDESYQVTGDGWIDREWSSQFLLDSQQGWDWFALRLNEESSLIVFQLRDSNSGKANYTHARIMYRDGQQLDVPPEGFSLAPQARTKIEGSDYPTEWLLTIPSQEINISISALNPMAKMPLTVPYWEGPVEFNGSHRGTGYMELTGY